ncbi:6-phospho-3-hexuloisomerase [Metabacillus indicus]|uniref:6-phospho-3-hexuloisomerase n=1 Tax=Metabacillus indicus TaxID=246786 RepID=UPI00317845C0
MSGTDTILKEIETVLGKIDDGQLIAIAEELNKNRRIFVTGEGRSGLMAKSFAMRLMHLGAEVYAVGETITPGMSGDDILVAVSGSGKTKSVLWTAEKAKELGCFVLAVTADPEGPLAETAFMSLHVPAATKYRKEGEQPTVQPLGSLFDQCVHLLFDAICLKYADLKKVSNEQAFLKHSNVE